MAGRWFWIVLVFMAGLTATPATGREVCPEVCPDGSRAYYCVCPTGQSDVSTTQGSRLKCNQSRAPGGAPSGDCPDTPPPPPPMAVTGHLQVNVNVPGAKVYVADAYAGEAAPGKPLNQRDLTAGEVTVEVRKKGYRTAKKQVNVPVGQWEQVLVELVQEGGGSGGGSSSNSLDIEFVRVSGGSFQMGCGSWQSGCFDKEKPVQSVTVGSFELGKYEVTQGQWRAVMGINPSDFSLCGDDCPVEKVSWDDAQEFIKKLNTRGDGCTYRLPTEAEWEYACRSGGKDEKYCGGNDVDRIAWHNGNSESKTHPVGGKAANGLGLYDMSGNVWEWTCSDWGNYSDSGKNHAKCSSEDSDRVFRGSGWSFAPAYARSTLRKRGDPGYPSYNLGFRLVRTCP